MGSCLSKKKQSTPAEPPNDLQKSLKTANEKAQKTIVHSEAAAAVEKKPVFAVVNHGARKSTGGGGPGGDGGEKKKGETPGKKKKSDKEKESGAAAVEDVAAPVAEEFKPAPVRISSCTKEEVDAILIQCGRLSRSSSGKAASSEIGAGHRRYSGSKRSYDFDCEKNGENEEEEWGEKPVSRPSPQRTAPSRERSGSRERVSGGGGRRVSRSPGRRSEAPSSSAGTAANSERSRQPAKMVSVPAREKNRGVSPSAGANKKGGEMAPARNASPRRSSRSPARSSRTTNENALHQVPPPPANQPQSLSRSSSRKAEQSPYRRSPMAEIDENFLRAHNNGGNDSKVLKIRESASQIQIQKAGENSAQIHKSEQKPGSQNSNMIKANNVVAGSAREQLLNSGRTKENNKVEAETTEEDMKKGSSNGSEVLNAGSERLGARSHSRTNSFRRSSRDFDNLLNPISSTSLLLDELHNLQQHQNTAFSLPACVSKACSILEAVADLNSTSSGTKSSEGGRSNNDNGLLRGFAPQKESFMESELAMKDDLFDPSLHKYVTVRDLGVGDFEPQESAGSNSFLGQPWSSSPWEPTSVNSSDRYGTSKSNNGEEVEQESEFSQQPSSGNSRESGTRGRRSSNNFMAPTTSSDKRRELQQHGHLQRASSNVTVGSGKSGGGRP